MGGFGRWMGHRGPHVQVMSNAALAALSWAGTSLTGAVLLLAGVALQGWSMVTFLRHEYGLCERCVAAVPDNPGQWVEEHAALLRRHHWLNRSMPVLRARLALTLAAGPYCLLFGGPGRLTGMWLALTVLSLPMLTAARHRSVSPWCPYCREEDDGDDGEEVPEPDPDPGTARPVPVR